MTTTVMATSYGGPESLSVIEEPTPDPAAGQVRIRTRAIGVNPIDYKLYASGEQDDSRLPIRLGFEAAGVVDAVGEGVEGVAVGDDVIAHPAPGAYTTDLVVDVGKLTPKPADLDWEHAAGLMLTGRTAWGALDATGAGAGNRVLVHGGAGGVGQMVLQLARVRGIEVVATASERNHELLASLGATPIAYGDGLLERAREAVPEGYTAVIDAVGTDEAIDASLALVPCERVVSIAAFGRSGDGITLIDGGPASARPELARLAASGEITVTIDRTYPLADAAAAHAYLRTGHARGKVVLLP